MRIKVLLACTLICIGAQTSFAENKDCSATSSSNSANACENTPASSKDVVLVGINSEPISASAIETFAKKGHEEHYKTGWRENVYTNAIFWILAALAPISAGLLVFLNLMDYKVKRREAKREDALQSMQNP